MPGQRKRETWMPTKATRNQGWTSISIQAFSYLTKCSKRIMHLPFGCRIHLFYSMRKPMRSQKSSLKPRMKILMIYQFLVNAKTIKWTESRPKQFFPFSIDYPIFSPKSNLVKLKIWERGARLGARTWFFEVQNTTLRHLGYSTLCK